MRCNELVQFLWVSFSVWSLLISLFASRGEHQPPPPESRMSCTGQKAGSSSSGSEGEEREKREVKENGSWGDCQWNYSSIAGVTTRWVKEIKLVLLTTKVWSLTRVKHGLLWRITGTASDTWAYLWIVVVMGASCWSIIFLLEWPLVIESDDQKDKIV